MLFIKKKKEEKVAESSVSNIENEKEEQYKLNSVKAESFKGVKNILKVSLGIVAFIVFLTVFTICSRAYGVNIWVGHIVLIAFIILVLYFFVYPIKKMLSNYFILSYDEKNYKSVKRHNDKVVVSIANNILDFNDSVGNVNSCYSLVQVDELRHAVKNNNITNIRHALTKLMNNSVKKKSNDVIVKWSVRAAILSAVSQSDVIDSILIIIANFMLIRDLIFLYGFRYSVFRLLKSAMSVFYSAVLAYNLQNMNLGKGFLDAFGSFLKSTLKELPLPVPQSVTELAYNTLGVIADSSIQGLSNGFMTAFIGYQTIRYLNKEYNLEAELNDNIETLDLLGINNNKDFSNTLNSIKTEVVKEASNKKQ